MIHTLWEVKLVRLDYNLKALREFKKFWEGFFVL